MTDDGSQTPAPLTDTAIAAGELEIDELNKLRRVLGFVRLADRSAAASLRSAFIADVDEQITSWLRAINRNPDPPVESGASGPIEGP